MLLSLQNSQAAFSAKVFDKAYQIWYCSQSSTELQEDSSRATSGLLISLALTVDEDEVRTTRLNDGFFLQERSTFKVPSIAGFKISAYMDTYSDGT